MIKNNNIDDCKCNELYIELFSKKDFLCEIQVLVLFKHLFETFRCPSSERLGFRTQGKQGFLECMVPETLLRCCTENCGGLDSVYGRWDRADGGIYESINLLCIAANGSCLQ